MAAFLCGHPNKVKGFFEKNAEKSLRCAQRVPSPDGGA
jgi:hypothetical protein